MISIHNPRRFSMIQHKTSKLLKVFFIFVFLLTAGTNRSQSAEKSAFTIEDSLRIKSVRIQSITKDGRFIAATVSQSNNRLGINHKRFRDPTYIAPRPVEAVVMDTENNKTHHLFNMPKELHSMSWSPDGKKMAFFLRREDRFYLQIYERTTQKIKEVLPQTDKEVASNSFLIWANDNQRVILALREKGWRGKSRKMFQNATKGPVIVYDSRKPFLKWDAIRDQSSLQVIALVEIGTGKVEEVLPENRYFNVRIAEDDSFLTYVQMVPVKTEYGENYYREGGREYELFKRNLEKDAEPHVLIEKTNKRLDLSWNEHNTLFAWDDDGDIFAQSVFEEKARNLTKDKFKPEKRETKAEKDKDPKEKKVRFSVIRWSPDSKKLLARTQKGFWLIDYKSGELEMIYEFPEEQQRDSQRGGPRPITVESWSPDGRFLYMTYSATDRWERGFTRYDLQEKEMEDLVKDSNLYRNLRMSKNGEKFFYQFSDGDLPSDLYMTDKDFQQKVRMTTLNSWIANKKLTHSELVKYLDVDGNKLYGILYYPVDYEPGKKYPLVCEIYERFFDNGFRSSMNILANQGFFGLRPSVNLEIGYPGEAWVKGVTCAINKLIERGLVIPDQIGVHGTSYGGYATSLLITQTDRFAAAVNISGKVNIISFLGDSPRIGHRNYGAAEAGQDRIGATLWEQPLKYINHSAVMFADRITTPHLLITGQGDWNVPAGNTREMYYALRRLGKECVWVNYWNDGHGLSASESEDIYKDKWNRVIDWYQTYFSNTEEAQKSSKPL
ncbi:MAG: prolyl oligopeptidase family serine peptidase [Candidatus Aminicenantes bacterium]|nr:prolyl oligopeptidase family serine peptidase [Candidatus Aminicenantes bacterium]